MSKPQFRHKSQATAQALSLSQGRIFPPPLAKKPGDSISASEWGFVDTSFAVDADGAITVTGNRYPGLSGQ
nr:hypothetical protein [Gemmatimonadota bacterium]